MSWRTNASLLPVEQNVVIAAAIIKGWISTVVAQHACTHTLTYIPQNKTNGSVYTDAYRFCLQCLLDQLSIDLQAEMFKRNASGLFDLVNLFIMQQECEMQHKLNDVLTVYLSYHFSLLLI